MRSQQGVEDEGGMMRSIASEAKHRPKPKKEKQKKTEKKREFYRIEYIGGEKRHIIILPRHVRTTCEPVDLVRVKNSSETAA
jgi:hypothetical protein